MNDSVKNALCPLSSRTSAAMELLLICTALALGGCGDDKPAEAGNKGATSAAPAGAAGGKPGGPGRMPPPEVGVVTVQPTQVGLVTELPEKEKPAPAGGHHDHGME